MKEPRRSWLPLGGVLIAIIVTGVCLVQGEETTAPDSLRKQLPFDSEPHTVGDIDVTPIAGVFNKTLTNKVRRGQEKIYTFNYTEYLNTTRAVRIHVSAPNTSSEFPALFVVRQQRFILSWQVPLMLENVYDYYNVSRTLCPVERDQKKEPTEEAQIYVDVSSASTKDIHFVLRAEFVEHFELTSDEWHIVALTPPEPKYFLYKFPEGVSSVVVKVESDDRLCMLFSIQNTQCPVFDLVRNVEFTGEYQTVSKKGAITVTRDEFPNGQFFVVFVVRPEDFQCLGVETLRPPPGKDPDLYIRNKTLQVKIEQSISESQYLGAVLGAVTWFVVFYVIALFISIVYALTDRTGDDYTEPIQAESTNTSSPSIQENDWTAAPPSENETDNLIVNANNVSNPGTPGTETSMSYGAIGAASDAATPPGTLSGAEFGKGNGIPHRIAPSNSDDSDSDYKDYDMLHDAEREKDVFRTKTILFVSDLARKQRKRLDKKYKLYHWNLITISIFYALPVVQLVITYQTVLHVTGNEDICYYNFYCTRPLGVLSSFNNVFSNIGYVMLGLLFLLLVLRKEMLYKKMIRKNNRLETHYGIPQHFGLFYAMGIALSMEGVLSGCYHVCPSYSNFQFDTSFMYMIGWLCMLKIYQTRHPDINPHAHVAYFAIAFVIFLAVVGVVYGTLLFWILFGIVHILLTLFISTQIYYMGRWRLDVGIIQRFALYLRSDVFRCSRPLYLDRMILLIIGNLVNISLTLYGVIMRPKDFASLLLSIFIINLLMYFAFYIIMKLRSKERILPVPLLFSLIAMVTWGFAFYFFLAHLTSWQKTPALSREGNKDCLLFDFYDDHDIWHMLSSMGLFFCFMILLTLDDDLIHTPRDRIYVF